MLQLNRLQLTNFKGHKVLDISFSPTKTIISGENGTGKTTVADAFYWLLTGKDSLGRKDVNFRPNDSKGELVHDIDVSVTAHITVNGIGHDLQRVFKEQYGTNRSRERVFRGNTTEYFIDTIPHSEKEYTEWVGAQLHMDKLLMLMNAEYVPNMPWQEQRLLVMEVAGDVTDNMVISANPELAELPGILNGREIKDLAKLAKCQAKPLRKSLEELPIRIDQEVKDLPSKEDLKQSIENETTMLHTRQAEVDRLNGELSAASKGDMSAIIRAKNVALEQTVNSIKVQHHVLIDQATAAYNAKRAVLDGDILHIRETLNHDTVSLERAKMTADSLKDRVNKLAEKWKKVSQEEFIGAECPFCHRPYEPDKVEQLKAEFNKSKADKLKSIVTEGTTEKKKYLEAQAEVDRLQSEITQANESLGKLTAAAKDLSDALTAALKEVPALEDMDGFLDARNQLDLNNAQLRDLTSGKGNPVAANIRTQLMAAQEKLRTTNSNIADYKSQLRRYDNIAKLEAQKDELRKQNDLLNITLDLIRKFTLAKISMVEGSIKKAFPGLEFKLFKQNISNDDIEETCELMMHGTVYRGLSTGEKIMAGMIIVNRLQETWNLTAPVFVDNAESITLPLEFKAQAILMKADNHKKLKVAMED